MWHAFILQNFLCAAAAAAAAALKPIHNLLSTPSLTKP
jgi:hypothetical protein